jgi:cytoskeleton protein RodZ
MSTSPNEAKRPAAAAAPVGPGARLAQARLDLHRSPEEVAAKLHLSARQIQALEEDYTSLPPGATYVRGYLKSYALLLGIEPAPILEAHARLTAKPAAPDFSAIAPQKELTSRHHQVRFTTYLVIAVVIGLALAWWQGLDTRPPNPLLTAPEPAPLAANGESTPPTGGAEAERPAMEPPATPVAPVTDAAKPATAPATTVAPPAAAPPVAAPVLPAGPRARLVLYADQDTWADIRDARQVKLLYETVAAGRVVTLEGVAPVSIFLGNAVGARLDYNGRAVDVARHKRGMVARFTLGEEEAAVAP